MSELAENLFFRIREGSPGGLFERCAAAEVLRRMGANKRKSSVRP